MKLRNTLCILLALLTLGTAGCSNAGGAISLFSGTALALEPSGYEEEVPAFGRAAEGANDFAFRLSRELLRGGEEDNFLCSPYSVWLPLAALANATGEEHRVALLTALGAAGITAGDLNRAASRMLYDLTRERTRDYGYEYHNPLSIANAVFVDKNQTLNGDFAQAFLDYYRGQAMEVDFSSPSAAKAVNNWAEEHTGGLIEEIVQEFDPNTVAALANAIFFSDRWGWEFNPDRTIDGTFHGTAGDSAARLMLREGDNQTYYEDDRLQAMPLGFASGGALYILLPKDGDAAGLLADMDEAYFREIREDSVQATGKLLLPRFEIESGLISLKGALEALGVPLFDAAAAPLTGGLVAGSAPVWLSDAVQKAVITVDEQGTTAAAVTVLVVAGAAMPEPTEPFEMICDRPFVFLLCGHTFDGGSQILFTGVVNRMSQWRKLSKLI